MEVGDDGSIASADVWSDPGRLAQRAQFSPEAFPALLRLRDVAGADAGLYRCRVDFTEAPTRNSLVNLTVVGKKNVGRELNQCVEAPFMWQFGGSLSEGHYQSREDTTAQ